MSNQSNNTETYDFPLSFAQERLWFLHQLEPDNSAYNIFAALQLDGNLNRTAIQQAFDYLVQRHEILRTRFLVQDDVAVQRVFSSSPIQIQWLKKDPTDHQTQSIVHEAKQYASQPFNLSNDPLIRIVIYQTAAQSHMLTLTIHHIIADAWSMSVFIRELTHCYSAFCDGISPTLPELTIQYADFSLWQREQMQGNILTTEIEHWRQQLDGAPSVINLPIDHPRRPTTSYRAARERLSLSSATISQAKQLAKRSGASLYMVLLAAFKVLLARVSGQHDIVVGSLIANRNRTELEALIGFFVNTLVLRSQLDDNPNFNEFVQQVKKMTLEAYSHQTLPFEQLVDALQPERDLSYAPLVQTLFVMQNTPLDSMELTGLQITPLADAELLNSRFDLEVYMTENDSQLSCDFIYRTELFDPHTVRRLAHQYETLLINALASPNTPIYQLSLMNHAEWQILHDGWHWQAQAYPEELCIHQLFEQQANKNPNQTAIVWQQQRINYAELNRHANQLAHYLLTHSITSETMVGICMERSIHMVIAMLGVLKAGAAYVPLDPNYPAQRMTHMLQDSATKLVISQTSLLEKLPSDITTLQLDGDGAAIAAYPNHNPQLKLSSRQLAYVIYTSGSTGLPKGVAIEHRSACALIHWSLSNYDSNELQAVLASTSICFDLSIYEIFVTLSHGGKIILLENALDLINRSASEAISLINTVPSAIATLLRLNAIPSSVTTINLAGEPLAQSLVEQLYQQTHVKKIYDLYGPSEDTTYSTYVWRKPGQQASIGRPITNTLAYVVDQYVNLVPEGIEGELLLGGHGLARGYLNQASLTQEKFIANPFCVEKSARLYRTGDLVRYRQDGHLEYLGRIDQQVKVRGFRIELSEVQSVINSYPGVRENIVLVQTDNFQSNALVAYVVPQTNPLDTHDLLQAISQRLAGYMVPSAIVVLDSIPLTPNGKVDRQALPKPSITQTDHEYVAPRNTTEQTLSQLWCKILDLSRVGIHDNFFQLGGHSLLATQITAHLLKERHIRLPVRAIFEQPTIAGLADIIRQKQQNHQYPNTTVKQGQSLPITTVDRTVPLPLSFAQQRLWFLSHIDQQQTTYNVHMCLRLAGALDSDLLQQALQQTIQRHEMLRTTFTEQAGQPVQIVHPELNCQLAMLDLSSLADSQRLQQAKHQAEQMSRQSFDLQKGPLFQISLLRFKPDDHLLVVVMHHMISDGWSLNLLIHDVSVYYQAAIEDISPDLTPLTVQYGDFAVWHRQQWQPEQQQQSLAYWKKQLHNAPLMLMLPTDRPRSPQSKFIASSENFIIDSPLTEKILTFSQQHNASLFMVTLSAYAALLNLYSQQQDLVIGTPIANRSLPEVESLIGFFVNSLALRIRLPEALDFQRLVAQVKQTALNAYAHQDLPFEHVVEALQPERCLDQHPIFQTLFVLQNAPPPVSHITSLAIEPFSIESHFSMFDLMCSITQINNQLHGMITYNAALFNKNSIKRLIQNYTTLLEAAIQNPICSLDKLDLRSDLERKTLATWSHRQVPITTNLVTLLEQQCDQIPYQTALIDNHQSLSYQALNHRANQLAAWLNQQGLQVDDKIALLLTRSHTFFITLFAALKIGASYVVIDPDYPPPRINAILNDCRAKLVLSDVVVSAHDPQHPPYYTMAALTDELDQYSTYNQDYPIAPHTIAYVLYTSGSTGTPKGVAMPHAALCNLVQWHIQHARLGQAARTLQFAAATFDVCFQEFATTLATGGTLVICPTSARHDPYELITLLMDQHIERLYLPFVALQQLASVGNNSIRLHLRDVITAGEQLQISTPIKDFFSSIANCQLHNHYGPTETHVVTALSLTYNPQDWPLLPPIGQPLPNVQLFILNRHQQPVPIGMPGEIAIGGMCLAQGYLNQADLTARRFTLYHVDESTSIRLYHTGDLARWQADGNIEYLGRLDHQVKIRGFRVEPGEVEAALANHKQVRDVAVVTRDDGQGLRLVGYYTATQSPALDSQSLRDWLRGYLPEYMIPSHFISLDYMPLTNSGKIDRRQLPAPCPTTASTTTRQAPLSSMEQTLHSLWCELLEFTAIDRQANFFDLGGHSLLAMRLTSQLRHQLNCPISVRTIFEYPTIAQLASVLDNPTDSIKQALHDHNASNEPPALQAIDRSQPLPLSYAQEQLWFLDQLEGQTANYNMPFALQLTGNLDITALQTSLNQLIDRHEILRSYFQFDNEQLTQHITPSLKLHIKYTDLRHQNPDIQQHQAESIADQEAKQPFDLQQGPLIRAQLLQLPNDQYILLMTMHHIICDGWSINIFTQELAEFYNSQRQAEIAQLSPLSIQYADYAHWQRQWLSKSVLTTQLNYWQQQLAGAPEFINLPSKQTMQTGPCAIASESFTGQLSQDLVSFSRSQNATLYMTMLAGFSILLQRISGQQDLVIGTTMANRETPAIESLIGFFVNALPIRLQLHENQNFFQLTQQARQQVLDAHTHHTLPFEQLVNAIKPTRLANRHPIFQVMFNFQNTAFRPLSLTELSVEIMPSKRGASKYDLILSIINMGDEVRCSFEYDTDQFSANDIQQYISFYQTLLKNAIETPDRPIAELAVSQQRNKPTPPSTSTSTAKDAIEEFNF